MRDCPAGFPGLKTGLCSQGVEGMAGCRRAWPVTAGLDETDQSP